MALYQRWSAISANAMLSKIKTQPCRSTEEFQRRSERMSCPSWEKHLVDIVAVFRLGKTVALRTKLYCSASVCVET